MFDIFTTRILKGTLPETIALHLNRFYSPDMMSLMHPGIVSILRRLTVVQFEWRGEPQYNDSNTVSGPPMERLLQSFFELWPRDDGEEPQRKRRRIDGGA
jgi:hypothetical protein